MRWYCAHLLFDYRYATGESALVSENLVLFAGADSDDVFRQAEAYGERCVNEVQTWTADGTPVAERFVGVKTVVRLDGDEPGEGVEVSYLTITLPSGVTAEDYLSSPAAGVTIHTPAFGREKAHPELRNSLSHDPIAESQASPTSSD